MLCFKDIILLELIHNNSDSENKIMDKSIEEQYEIYKRQGMTKKDIIKQIAKNKNVHKNEIYKIFVND